MLGDYFSLILQTPMLPSEPAFWSAVAAIAVAAATAVLAKITYEYMQETKKMRIATENMVKATEYD